MWRNVLILMFELFARAKMFFVSCMLLPKVHSCADTEFDVFESEYD